MAETTQKAAASQSNRPTRNIAPPEEILLTATTLALSLARGRDRYEIETLINLISLTNDQLQSILAQLLINERANTELQQSI